MRVSDLQNVSGIDETITTLHRQLHELYAKRQTLLSAKTIKNDQKKSSPNEVDLSDIDLSLE